MGSYQSLTAWQHAHRLCLATLQAARGGDGAESQVVAELQWVVLRTASTLAKASAFDDQPPFRRYVGFALAYAIETEYLLGVAAQLEYLPGRALSTLRRGVIETKREIQKLLLDGRSP